MQSAVERSEIMSDDVETGANRPAIEALRVQSLSDALARETDFRRRAECMAQIQSDAVQLALDLLVREPDITGFFRAFITNLVEESESHGCGVWLLDHEGTRCDLWMAYVNGRFFLKGSHDWDALTLPRESLSEHFLAHTTGWTQTVEYAGDDAQLPEPVRGHES